MKKIKTILQLSILVITFAAANSVVAQSSKENKDAAMQQVIDSKKFVFIAQSMTPTRGGLRQLTSSYDLRIAGDSIISNLPYFGRAYTAPIDPSTGGFNFTSTSNDYKVVARKKGGWDISIKPKDNKDVQLFFLSVFSNGSATLQVTSNNRQPISFNGNVAAK